MEKRTLLNLILLGSVGTTVGAIGVPALLFFVPPGAGGGGGGLPALDANGNQVKKGEWLSTHQAGDRYFLSLYQPNTYLSRFVSSLPVRSGLFVQFVRFCNVFVPLTGLWSRA